MKHLHIKNHLLRFMLALGAFFFFTSCEKENSPMPAYVYDLCLVQLNEKGNIIQLLLDNGTTYTVNNPPFFTAKTRKPRVFTSYTINHEMANLRYCHLVYTTPIVPNTLKLEHNQPLRLHAVWWGGGYLNFHLSLSSGVNNYIHYLGVAYLKTTHYNNQKKTAELQLILQETNSTDFFTQKGFMSCITTPYQKELAQCDSIAIHYIGLDKHSHRYTFYNH